MEDQWKIKGKQCPEQANYLLSGGFPPLLHFFIYSMILIRRRAALWINKTQPESAMKMRALVIVTICLACLASSCTRYITTTEAANGKAKCGRMLR
jgi:hypothetical protein